MNAGELSPELAGRIDIKQYYSAGLRYLNIEPVAQSGFQNLPGTRISNRRIQTPYAGESVVVGRWVALRWESMPRVRVLPGDQVLRRPGRIHTVKANVIETTSIAIGANGAAPREVMLLRISDPVDRPLPPKTEL